MSDEDDFGTTRVPLGLEAVRYRLAMYVGDITDSSGPHRLVEMAAPARRPARIDVRFGDGTVGVADDGVPFPQPAGRPWRC